MQDFGIEKVNQLIKAYYQLYQDNPSSILPEHLHLNYLSEKVIDSTAYIFFNKPEDLNALNEKVIKELDNLFEKFNQNNQIKNIIITSTGKYFVAGADIKFFVENIEKGSIDKIIQFTKYAQSVFNKIDCSSKRVIVIMNGVTLGGGLELALCADEIFALPNASMGFPETGIGIYPGLGGTQRPQNRIGKELTKYLVFTGKILRSNEALEINLIDNIISLDDYILVLEGNLSPLKKSEKKNLSENWVKIINSFNKLNIQNLSESDELGKIILQKAPLAISYANKLIDESKGPESELKYLKDIFTSNDALKGLKNIGKKVSFEGK
jgi:enoyl-CoA hydratase/3-hydroxyacyl-CoA dehydrogenase